MVVAAAAAVCVARVGWTGGVNVIAATLLRVSKVVLKAVPCKSALLPI